MVFSFNKIGYYEMYLFILNSIILIIDSFELNIECLVFNKLYGETSMAEYNIQLNNMNKTENTIYM